MLPGREKKTEWLVIRAKPATRKSEGSLSKSVNICSTVSPPPHQCEILQPPHNYF